MLKREGQTEYVRENKMYHGLVESILLNDPYLTGCENSIELVVLLQSIILEQKENPIKN